MIESAEKGSNLPITLEFCEVCLLFTKCSKVKNSCSDTPTVIKTLLTEWNNKAVLKAFKSDGQTSYYWGQSQSPVMYVFVGFGTSLCTIYSSCSVSIPLFILFPSFFNSADLGPSSNRVTYHTITSFFLSVHRPHLQFVTKKKFSDLSISL